MRCAKCGAENPAGKRFCGDCGATLANRCARCGADNPPEKKFCGDCGTALGGAPLESKVRAEPDRSAIRVNPETTLEALDGERKAVTALFADIKGSTELMEDLDPEEARAIVDPALRLMIEAVGRYDGYVVQSTGDGIFALFGAFQLPTSCAMVNPNSISVNRDSPRHMTMLPGGGSLARAR
jgi:ribosomal protein L40E